MATRKSGDGSRGMNDGGSARSDSPGSYANVSGSRRKRKGKKGRETTPPPASASALASVQQPIEDTLDVEGEEVERSHHGRLTQPDWGQGDHSIDDLRSKKPSSSHAPRKVGPLGMEDARTDSEPSTRRASTPRPASPSGRMNVVEINATERVSDNSNDTDYDPSREDPFGDPFQQSFDRESDDADFDAAFERAASHQQTVRESAMPENYLRRTDAWDGDASVAARPSLSSVFDARPSLRPSPRPPANSSMSVLWWVVICALTGIIVAAGVIAVREAKQTDKVVSPSVPAQVAEPARAAASPAPVTTPKVEAQPAAPLIPAPAQAAKLPELKPVLTKPAPVGRPVTVAKPAAAAVLPKPRIVRPAPPPATEPAWDEPAAPARAPDAPQPAEHIPQNPYN